MGEPTTDHLFTLDCKAVFDISSSHQTVRPCILVNDKLTVQRVCNAYFARQWTFVGWSVNDRHPNSNGWNGTAGQQRTLYDEKVNDLHTVGSCLLYDYLELYKL